MRGGVRIYSPCDIVTKLYDVIVVATGYAKEVHDQALKMGFDLSRFVFVYNNMELVDFNQDYSLVSKIFGKEYSDVIRSRNRVIRTMMRDEARKSPFSDDPYRQHGMYSEDYIRIRTFGLVAEEIIDNNVSGNVAELGVFKGEFSKYINELFKDRVLYLFDTFEGFDSDEADFEKKAGNTGDAFIERFKNTSVQNVLNAMPYLERIVIKQGLFPDSLDGLDDRFSFVSIDVDFEQSIYEGIRYFYPRLNDGGYIFVHDYNSKTLKGVKKAIGRYEKDNGIRLCKVPIPDLCGTLVITK